MKTFETLQDALAAGYRRPTRALVEHRLDDGTVWGPRAVCDCPIGTGPGPCVRLRDTVTGRVTVDVWIEETGKVYMLFPPSKL